MSQELIQIQAFRISNHSKKVVIILAHLERNAQMKLSEKMAESDAI